MAVMAVDFIGREGEFSPSLKATSDMAEALQTYVAVRWPIGRRKGVAHAWRLTDDEARSVVEGKASKATISKIFHRDRGGWPVALAVVSAVVGHGLDVHLQAQASRHVHLARQHRAMVQAFRGGRPPGPAADL